MSTLTAQATTTTTACLASSAASNSSHLATNPLVSGTPTIAAAATSQT